MRTNFLKEWKSESDIRNLRKLDVALAQETVFLPLVDGDLHVDFRTLIIERSTTARRPSEPSDVPLGYASDSEDCGIEKEVRENWQKQGDTRYKIHEFDDLSQEGNYGGRSERRRRNRLSRKRRTKKSTITTNTATESVSGNTQSSVPCIDLSQSIEEIEIQGAKTS